MLTKQQTFNVQPSVLRNLSAQLGVVLYGSRAKVEVTVRGRSRPNNRILLSNILKDFPRSLIALCYGVLQNREKRVRVIKI
jgi:hypothetical protein